MVPMPASKAQPQPINDNHDCLQPHLTLHNFAIAHAIQQGRLRVNMSQLLGCDYIFIYSGTTTDTLFNEQHLMLSIQELIDILEVRPQQAQVIYIEDIDGQLYFTRHDIVARKGIIEQIHSSRINNHEQIEFMQMMLECSTPY